MVKKGHILLKKAQIDEKRNNNIFWIFSWKYGKIWKKVKSDEKGSDFAEKGPNWWKMKKIIFFGFLQENMKNVEKSEKWWKRVRYCFKMPKLMKKEKNNSLLDFFRRIWENVERSEKWRKRVRFCWKRPK